MPLLRNCYSDKLQQDKQGEPADPHAIPQFSKPDKSVGKIAKPVAANKDYISQVQVARITTEPDTL